MASSFWGNVSMSEDPAKKLRLERIQGTEHIFEVFEVTHNQTIWRACIAYGDERWNVLRGRLSVQQAAVIRRERVELILNEESKLFAKKRKKEKEEE